MGDERKTATHSDTRLRTYQQMKGSQWAELHADHSADTVAAARAAAS